MASKVSVIINIWKNFDLSGFQKILDSEAAEIAARQDESDVARKKLVELTREFKKSTPDEVRRTVAPLLKSFQSEVDSLSKRSKSAESAFLQAYKKLTDISDPLPILEYCQSIQQKVSRLQDLEIENKQLRDTLEEYNEEFKDVRNQDVTIKQLRERIKQYEEKQDEEIQIRMKELERALQREYEEKERTLQDAQTLMAKKVSEAEGKAVYLQRILDEAQSELLDLKNREEEKTYARSDEFELLMNDLDQANQRAALAEQAVEELRQQLTDKGGPGRDGCPGTGGSLQGTEGGPSSAAEMDRTLDLLNRNSLQLELAAKEKEISALVEDVQRLQSSLKQLRDTSGSQIARLEEQVTHKCQVIERLEQRLQSQADYDDVKRELLILKSIEFGSIKSEGNTETSGDAKPLEMLLLEKTKSLQTENTALKVSNSDTQGEEIVSHWRRLLDSSSSLTPRPPSACDRTSPPRGTSATSESVQCNGASTDSNDNSEDHKEGQRTPSQQQPQLNQQDIGDISGGGVGGGGTGGGPVSSNSFPEGSPTMGGILGKGDPLESRLQEMLRFNMDKYCHQSLDTLYLSRRVRELLSIHNIGQRLFAKFVLGLSQGTVSELLSKPKPWEKLTEKGRDSYRKMNAWACDENCVMLLKSLIPKRDTGVSPFKSEDPVAEERIALILNEASNAMRHQGTPNTPNSDSGDSSSPGPNNAQSPPLGKDKRLRKYENDDIPQEKVSRIYQEELAKMMGRDGGLGPHLSPGTNPKEPFPPSLLFPFLFSGSLPHRSQEEIRMALSIYHQELAKLHGHSPGGPTSDHPTPHSGVQDLSLPKCKEDEMSNVSNSSPLSGILPPMTSQENEGSPLARMASITNSLISQPNHPSLPSQPQRPLRAILPPITQHQFDQYSNLNTEDIVKKIKEQLSQYSISQRLFGESVLGLSQGSVSDLLARPKPWHMLTQKGREPFIRMRIFLEDDNAVHKLVASQYKIAPEKLMRTGGYGGARRAFQEQMNSKALIRPNEASLFHPKSLESPLPPTSMGAHLPPSTGPIPPPPMGMAEVLKKNPAFRGLNTHHSQPSVYEMAALTQDLDTQMITTKVKEVLLANNIGQKIFGEAVLGLSQGSVSELLSKPKPWHMLSIKGREPFIRMQLWLTDPINVDKLQQLKHQRREASKRRRSHIELPGEQGSVDSGSDFYGFQATSPGGSTKKARVLFSEEQKEALRLAFALDPYPSVPTIEFLAQELGLSSRTITNWFHNHRMRLKQQAPHNNIENGTLLHPPREGQPFDHMHFRMLLQQRLMELHKDRGVFPPMPTQYPYPYYNAMHHSLNKEQFSGLDLSMGSAHSALNLKREDNDYDAASYDDSSDYNDDSNISSPTGRSFRQPGDEFSEKDGECKQEQPKTEKNLFCRSRRKPAAPQWVNPEWQKEAEENGTTPKDKEVIINGVCVMKTEDMTVSRLDSETVRIEPTGVDQEAEAARQQESKEDHSSDEEALNLSNKGSPMGSEKHSPPASPSGLLSDQGEEENLESKSGSSGQPGDEEV